MTVRVLLFSVLRERVGVSELALALPEGARGEDLLAELVTRYPDVAAFAPYVRLAVNAGYTPASATLRDGDEVALITPTSGG